MNWTRIIMDGLAMSLLFNAVAGLGFLLVPQAYSNCKAWARREWLMKLAIPEHGLLWTFVVCQVEGLFVAGINIVLG